MFKLTEKAKQFNERFIIQHTECGDYDLSAAYFCVNEAIVYEVKDAGCSEEEMALTIREYTPEEVIKAAEDGYGWPEELGLAEEEENLENINEKLLKACINGVEDNNRCNDAAWSDWQDEFDVIDCYGKGDFCDDVRFVIQRAIESNGESLKEDLPMIERQLKGQNFAGSFYDRK